MEVSSKSESTDEIEPEPETEVKKPKTEVNDSGFKHFTEKPTIEAETSEKEESKTEDSTERTKIVKRNANEQKASKIAKMAVFEHLNQPNLVRDSVTDPLTNAGTQHAHEILAASCGSC